MFLMSRGAAQRQTAYDRQDGGEHDLPRDAITPKVKSAHYDPRIDFFRGLALIFIFINHIPDNTVTYFTSRTVTLFDSAEVFMFLAGYSAALAYYTVISTSGMQGAAQKALGRARVILGYHVALVVFVIATSWLIEERLAIKTGYEAFIEKVQADPYQVALATPLLGFQAPLLDILPMYVMVMLMAPFLIWIRSRSEIGLLVASVLLWMFASRFFPSIPTVTYSVAWNFNPFCWQFLFAIGLVFGWRTRSGAPPVCGPGGRHILDVCSILFVLFSACVLMTIAFQTINLEAAQRLRAMYFSLNKQTLDLWRVAGLLATAYLVARFVSRDAAWLSTRFSRWLCAVGAHSLPIFALTVVLSFTGKFATHALGDGVWWSDVLVSFAGAAIIIAVALLLTKRKRSREVPAVRLKAVPSA
jgi:hypothetical protein